MGGGRGGGGEDTLLILNACQTSLTSETSHFLQYARNKRYAVLFHRSRQRFTKKKKRISNSSYYCCSCYQYHSHHPCGCYAKPMCQGFTRDTTVNRILPIQRARRLPIVPRRGKRQGGGVFVICTIFLPSKRLLHTSGPSFRTRDTLAIIVRPKVLSRRRYGTTME